MNEMPPPKFVTIDYFWRDMLGRGSRTWFYNHVNDPGFPQRVYPDGGRPMLLYDDCKAYVDKLLAQRAAKQKRRVGRPAAVPKRLRG